MLSQILFKLRKFLSNMLSNDRYSIHLIYREVFLPEPLSSCSLYMQFLGLLCRYHPRRSLFHLIYMFWTLVFWILCFIFSLLNPLLGWERVLNWCVSEMISILPSYFIDSLVIWKISVLRGKILQHTLISGLSSQNSKYKVVPSR